MYPHERALVKNLAGKPFALVGVNSDRDKEALQDVLEEEDISWRSFWNGPEGTGGPISKAWNVKGWPTVYILDTEGKIVYKGHGRGMDQALEKALASAGHEVDLSDLKDPKAEEEEKEDDDSKEDSDDDSKEDAKGGNGE